MREQFEKLFSVPEVLERVGNKYCLKPDFNHWVNVPTESEYNALWQGFQAGHAAGLEAAAKYLDTLNVDEFYQPYGLANNIRAMKP